MLKPLMVKKEHYLYEKFRLTDQFSEESISLGKLLDERSLMLYLKEIKDDLGTESVFVAASQFMKRVGYILTVPFLYSMTILDKKLTDHVLDSLLISKIENQKWMPNLYIRNNIQQAAPVNHAVLRKEVLEEMFGTIALIIDQLAKVSSVPKSILWENVAIYVYWLYQTKLQEEEFLVYQHQTKEDFTYILHEMPGHIFNQCHNPIKHFYSQKNNGETAQPHIRKTCCFYYETTQSNGKFCGGCPKKCH